MCKLFKCPFWLASCACLGLFFQTPAHAQLLCERVLPSAALQYFGPHSLVQVRPDSLWLLSIVGRVTNNVYQTTRQVAARINVTTCDTVALPGSTTLTPSPDPGTLRVACVTRRGEVLIVNEQITGRSSPSTDSTRLRFTLLGRNGRVRWSRLMAPCSYPENSVASIIEAPGGGFYAAANLLMRTDSLGNLLWCRRYPYFFGLVAPTYSSRGTLLYSVQYAPPNTARHSCGVLELSQRGDSIGFTVVGLAGAVTTSNIEGIFNLSARLRPLRDGGVLFAGIADSVNANAGRRPFLARLDRNLRVSWVFALPNRRVTTNVFRMDQPFELADGTILVLVTSEYSGLGQPFWLYRFSAAGILLQRYPFTSQVLPPRANAFLSGFLGLVQGVQPLRDSTFMMASAYNDVTRNHTYLAHLRVPGLPRVLNSSFFPLAARPGAALALEALGPPHPNPVAETVAFAYTLPLGTRTARLVLTDVLGRPVADVALAGATGQATLPVQALPPGLYVATLRVNGQLLASRKLAVVR